MAWSSFEHQIWQNFLACNLQDQNKFDLCISGGLDSIVLLHLFLRLKPQASLHVLHYHHGDDPVDLEQQNYRDSCLKLLKDLQLKYLFKMTHERADKRLKSEDEFRTARWDFIQKNAQSDIVVTAHHLDDRFETILLKLIRGSSLEGVTSFRMWNQRIFRPLLNVSKQALLDYAQENKLEWVEDPSNSGDSYLRNWVRNKWLPSLDEKVNKGSENFAKSLDRLIQSQSSSTFEQEIEFQLKMGALDRKWYSLLSKNDQLRALASFLRSKNETDFTTGQLEEIRKRLDKNQKDITFEILKRKWVINATQIVIE